jgi:hypothetical protein
MIYFHADIFSSQTDFHPEIGLLRRTPLLQLQWCSELKFLGQKTNPTVKLKNNLKSHELHTFPGQNNNIINNNKLGTDSSTISDKNEFNENEGKVIGLTSFPGSGNTWLRYLLQQATGIYTGSVYKDYGLLKSGFPAESISNSSVLIVKTHEFGSTVWPKFRKVVLLIRDPAKAILAEFNRQSGGHIGFASPDR